MLLRLQTLFTGRFSPLFPLLSLYLVFGLLLRLILWGKFGAESGVHVADLLAIALRGVLNDSVQALYLFFPLTLYLALLPEPFHARRSQRLCTAVLIGAGIFLLLQLGVAEYLFFDEFDARFNLVAVDYLIYPTEVLGNIGESYPVLPILFATALTSAALLYAGRRFLPKASPGRAGARRLLPAGHLATLFAAAVLFDSNTLSLSNNRVNNELAANGLSRLFLAFRTNELDYSAYYRTIDTQRAFSLVRNAFRRSGRAPAAGADGLRAAPAPIPATLPAGMNVVVIVEESFGAGFIGAYGHSRGLTPEFDRLAQEGLLFRNAFATGTRTVRGLEAITTSLPPIPSESVIKRPGNSGIANWGGVMQKNGYHTSFLYGGYAPFDNMGPFFSGNGFAVSDRSDIKSPRFANIWGVSDQDLFDHALGYYDARAGEKRPFFSLIMTTSNHRPYTLPDNIPGIPASGGGRKAGVRYADYALGEFLRKAGTHAWFDNTLFVVVADHDARVYGRAEIPVDNYRIPLLFYAPGRIVPGGFSAPVSQIDIAPTVLALLGIRDATPFYGSDVLHEPATAPRPILLSHNHDVALLQDEALVVLGLNRSIDAWSLDPKDGHQTKVAVDPDLADLATAYYQTAFDLFHAHRYL